MEGRKVVVVVVKGVGCWLNLAMVWGLQESRPHISSDISLINNKKEQTYKNAI